MTKAISYLRFSTKRQGAEGTDSTRRQLSLAVAWCKQNNVELDDSIKYHDLGVSAYRGKNAAVGMLRGILDEVKSPHGRIRSGDYLLVEAIDRLSRTKPLDAFEIIKAIIDADLTIVTLIDGQRYSKDSLNDEPGKIYILFGSIQSAHTYSQNLSHRSKEVHKRKRSEMADGKKTKHMCPSWLTWDDKKRAYVPNAMAPLIKAIWTLRSQPGFGRTKIVRELQGKYTLPPKKSWEEFVSRILDAPEVTGERTIYKWDGVKGKLIPQDTISDYYPAIVDRETYDTARQHMSNESFYSRGGHEAINNLFTSLLSCGRCGGKIIIQSAKGLRYINCKRKRMHRDCDGVSVRLDLFEARVLHFLAKELTASDLMADKAVSADLIKILTQGDLTKMRIKEMTQKVEALAERMADADLSEAVVKRLGSAMNKYETDIEDAQREYDAAMARASSMQSSIGSFDAAIMDVRELVIPPPSADENPEGESLHTTWARITSTPHPMQILETTDRAKLRTAIAALVDSIVVQHDKGAEIKFKTGDTRRVEPLKVVRRGWGTAKMLR